MKINHYNVHRYTNSLSRYREQLRRGTKILSTKTAKKYEDKEKGDVVPLNDSDIKRIKKEISILENKLENAGFKSLI